jgi:hypothetical protein
VGERAIADAAGELNALLQDLFTQAGIKWINFENPPAANCFSPFAEQRPVCCRNGSMKPPGDAKDYDRFKSSDAIVLQLVDFGGS